MDDSSLREIIAQMCDEAGEPSGAAEQFFQKINEYPEVKEDFIYYCETKDFLCKLKVSGITVADIVVWQIDRFKAAIDEGRFELKYNGAHMVLSAYYTMCDVIDNPERYLNRFRSETGSDYPGKDSCYDRM